MAAALDAGPPAAAAEPAGAQDLWRALYPALLRGLKDRVATIFTGSLKARRRPLCTLGCRPDGVFLRPIMLRGYSV